MRSKIDRSLNQRAFPSIRRVYSAFYLLVLPRITFSRLTYFELALGYHFAVAFPVRYYVT